MSELKLNCIAVVANESRNLSWEIIKASNYNKAKKYKLIALKVLYCFTDILFDRKRTFMLHEPTHSPEVLCLH